MAGRIVLFGATGYTGRLVAEAMVERGLRPVLAARSAERLARAGRRARSRARDGDRPTCPTRRACGAGRGRRRAGDHGRAVRALGRPGGGRRVDRGRALPRLHRRAALHPRGVRALRRGGRAERRRRWSPRSATTGCRATWPARSPCSRAGEAATRVDTGYFITGDSGSMSGGTRASLAGVMSAPGVRVPGRPRAERARGAPRALVPRRREGAERRLGRQLGALRAAAPGAAAAGGERLPRLVRSRLARDAGALRRHRAGDEGARAPPGSGTPPPRASSRARPAGRTPPPGRSPARTSWRSPTTRRAASSPRCT